MLIPGPRPGLGTRDALGRRHGAGNGLMMLRIRHSARGNRYVNPGFTDDKPPAFT